MFYHMPMRAYPDWNTESWYQEFVTLIIISITILGMIMVLCSFRDNSLTESPVTPLEKLKKRLEELESKSLQDDNLVESRVTQLERRLEELDSKNSVDWKTRIRDQAKLSNRVRAQQLASASK